MDRRARRRLMAQRLRGTWSEQEHAKYLEIIEQFPNGPWGRVAAHVGTRSARQVQTHHQKYQEKIARRDRGLLKVRKRMMRTEHRIDDCVARNLGWRSDSGSSSSSSSSDDWESDSCDQLLEECEQLLDECKELLPKTQTQDQDKDLALLPLEFVDDASLNRWLERVGCWESSESRRMMATADRTLR